MQRRLSALALAGCLVLGACGDDGGDEAPAEGGPRGLGTAQMAGEGDSPAFALVRGQDTLLVERYTLSANRVTGVMRDPTGSSVEYETVHSTTGGERSMRVTLNPADPNTGPPIVTTFTLRGDSAFMVHTRGDSTIRQSDAVPANALPYLSPSMGMMALVAQSARSLAGDSGQVALLAAAVSQNPVVVQPLIFWRADTAWVVGDQMNRFRLVFENGQLLSAENPPQQLRAVALPRGTSAAPATGSNEPPR